ncbi:MULTISPECIES: PadR family transcriptional regulator [Pseudomonas]|uniref:Transcriptional regulator, PadR family n=1 Tax=Pseudomonas syringae pv. syringae (strain B728a) TaxID=205918 RepID=Q4ZPG6_PSEU2|nr:MULTISPECIES: PadR family transcriptional regulator [Pseudomonas]AAY38956.1 transcriptional regulator, PadR family [Pseudomonas syringae pv. syringae B728a]EGH73123.1 transcriptional regulator PadR-like protein [Pseudomonas syringae pv. aceris str. M302273]MCH5516780.1 PadR family transcriptional regulator [Pseudomonas syringae pv. syringae]MCH5553998.1 PadR family transcriptional regulator [Pseudomonas syringae pv. syringae]MCH5574182.1 PadR family transcriptional regulator [Pseudomonas sy
MREDKHPPHHRPPHLREAGEDRDGFEKRPGRERGGRGPRVFAPGDLKLLLLALIAEQPAHGYDLIRKIEGLFEGAYCPSPGVIYPTLTFLEESEMVAGDAQAGKKLYTVTDAGRQSLEDQAVALEGVRMRIDVSKRSLRGHDRPPEIHEAVHNLRHALQMHHGRWSPEEILRVSELLNSTARAVVDGPQPASEESA